MTSLILTAGHRMSALAVVFSGLSFFNKIKKKREREKKRRKPEIERKLMCAYFTMDKARVKLFRFVSPFRWAAMSSIFCRSVVEGKIARHCPERIHPPFLFTRTYIYIYAESGKTNM